MLRECYEDRDASGESICGYHREPLAERTIPSQTQRQPMTVLICPINGKQLRYVQ